MNKIPLNYWPIFWTESLRAASEMLCAVVTYEQKISSGKAAASRNQMARKWMEQSVTIFWSSMWCEWVILWALTRMLIAQDGWETSLGSRSLRWPAGTSPLQNVRPLAYQTACSVDSDSRIWRWSRGHRAESSKYTDRPTPKLAVCVHLVLLHGGVQSRRGWPPFQGLDGHGIGARGEWRSWPRRRGWFSFGDAGAEKNTHTFGYHNGLIHY